jgi:hypothetical protein
MAVVSRVATETAVFHLTVATWDVHAAIVSPVRFRCRNQHRHLVSIHLNHSRPAVVIMPIHFRTMIQKRWERALIRSTPHVTIDD